MHLVVDGHGYDRGKFQDEELLYRFLEECPEAIGMTKIISPQLYTYRGRKQEDWGLSGFVLIAESHISVHTFPDRNYVNVDIFSCKDFDVGSSLQKVKEVFSLTEAKVWVLERGLDYMTSKVAYHGMVRERVGLSNGQGGSCVSEPCR